MEQELALVKALGPLWQLRSDSKNDVTYPTLESALCDAGLSAKSRLIALRALRKYEPEPDRNARFLLIPFLNVFYDLLFDEAPTVNQVKDLLNILIIITGLLSGGASSLFSAVSFSDIQTAIYRFSAPWDASWSFCNNLSLDQIKQLVEPSMSRCLSIVKGDGSFTNRYAVDSSYTGSFAIYIIDEMPFNANMAFGSMTSAIFLSVMMYIFITNSEFEIAERDEEANMRINAAWWKYARWSIVIVVFLLSMGLFYFAAAYLALDYIKFPSRVVETYDNWDLRYDAATTSLVSSYNYGVALLALIILVVVGMSIGLHQKTKEINRLRVSFVPAPKSPPKKEMGL